MSRYLLDACALIAFFNEEEGAEVVEALFESKEEIFISIVNVYEVYYDACRTDSIALGLGKQLNAKVVTADHHEFDKIEEKKSADFHWIR